MKRPTLGTRMIKDRTRQDVSNNVAACFTRTGRLWLMCLPDWSLPCSCQYVSTQRSVVYGTISSVRGMFVPGRFVPGLFVPLSYKMLGINNLVSKKFKQSSFYLSNVIFIYPASLLALNQ